MDMLRHVSRREDGASMLEFALVFPLLMLILIGLAEFGLGFRDMLTVNSASREAARVASAVGDDPGADCVIIEAAAAALVGVDTDAVQTVWIYEADDNGDPITGVRQVYRPATGADAADTLVCSDGWVQLEDGYPPGNRSVVSSDLDLLGVRVIFTHRWATQVPPFTGQETWTGDTIMRLEPQVIS